MADLVAPPTKQARSRRRLVVVGSGLFASLVVMCVYYQGHDSSELSSSARGFIDPLAYLASQSHQRIVNNEREALKMMADNEKIPIPCAFGVHCHIHVRPTFVERTGGAWLGQGQVTGLVPVQTDNAEGPWSKPASPDIPRPAHMWGDADRAASFSPEGGGMDAKMGRSPALKGASSMEEAHVAGEREEKSKLQGRQARVRASASPPRRLGRTEHEHKELGNSGVRSDSKFQMEEEKIESSKRKIKEKMAKLISQYDSSLTEHV